jgi:hypothetical protein
MDKVQQNVYTKECYSLSVQSLISSSLKLAVTFLIAQTLTDFGEVTVWVLILTKCFSNKATGAKRRHVPDNGSFLNFTKRDHFS